MTEDEARIVAWLRDAADQWRSNARNAATVGVASMRVAKAMALEEAADALSRGDHRRDA